MTRIEEGALLHLNILTCKFLISLTGQIPVFMGIISFDIWSCFYTTLLPTCQGRPNLLKSIITIIKRGLIRLLRNKIRDILGVHFWANLVDGPILPMVQTEIIARDLLESSSLFQIQTLQPKIQQSVAIRRNCEVMIQMERIARELYISSNIFLCRQHTNTTYRLYGNISARAF